MYTPRGENYNPQQDAHPPPTLIPAPPPTNHSADRQRTMILGGGGLLTHMAAMVAACPRGGGVRARRVLCTPGQEVFRGRQRADQGIQGEAGDRRLQGGGIGVSALGLQGEQGGGGDMQAAEGLSVTPSGSLF